MTRKNKQKKSQKKSPHLPVHFLPPSKCFSVLLPEVVENLCDNPECDHHALITDRQVIIDTEEQYVHGDYHILLEIAGPDNVNIWERPATAFVEAKDGSLYLKKNRKTRYFSSIETFGINVLDMVYERDGSMTDH
jgi:hypothetical protein